jgi:small subunit ribosomal protein S20
MANTKSAIKSIKKITRKSSINRSRKSRFKKAIKKMNLILEDKNKKEALTYFPKLNSEIMKIAKTGIIKKENAARNISRITKKINSL